MTARVSGLVALVLAAGALADQGAGPDRGGAPAPARPALLAPLARLASTGDDSSLVVPEEAAELFKALGPAPEMAHQVLADTAALPGFEAGERLFESAEAWLTWLARTGLPGRVLVDEASPAERSAAGFAARSIVLLAARAEAVITRAVDAMDHAAPARDGDPEARQRQLALAVQRTGTLLPLRAARAGSLLAMCEDDPERRALLAQAAAATARRVQGAGAWVEAQRRLALGLALLLSDDTAGAGAELDEALRAARDKRLPPDHARAIEVEITLGRALTAWRGQSATAGRELLERALTGPPFLDGEHAALEPGLLAGALLVQLARAEGPLMADERARVQLLASAYRRYASLVAGADPDGTDEPVRARVYERLAPWVPPSAPLEALPPVASMARARAPGVSLEERLRALRGVMAREEVFPLVLEADALFEMASLQVREAGGPEPLRESVRGFGEFARRFPGDPRAARSMALACAAGDRLLRASGPGSGPPEQDVELAISALRAAHESPSDLPGRDTWRLTLARVLVWTLARGAPADADAVAREIASIAQSIVDPDLGASARGEVVRAWGAALQVAQSRDDPEAAGRAAQRVLDACDALGAGGAGQSAVELERARALLALGRAGEAIESVRLVLEGAGAPAGAEAPGPSAGLIEGALVLAVPALLDEGKTDEAIASARRLEAIHAGAGARLAQRLAARAWAPLAPRTSGFIADYASGSAPGAPEAARALGALRLDAALSPGAPTGERLGWALLLAGQAQAGAEALGAVIQAHPGAETPSSLRGVGESRLSAGDLEGAFAAFRRLAEGEQAGGREGRDYWHAWTRLLEILGRMNADGTRTATIRQEVSRLRGLGSARDHADCLARLDVVLAGLAAPALAPGAAPTEEPAGRGATSR